MSGITEKFENDVLEKLKKALSSVVSMQIGLNEYRGALNKSTRLKEDLKMDIIAKDFFTQQVNENSNVKIPYLKMQEFETIGDYVDFIYKEEIFRRR